MSLWRSIRMRSSARVVLPSASVAIPVWLNEFALDFIAVDAGVIFNMLPFAACAL